MYPLTSVVTASNWHITGTVGDYSGFGFFFQTSASACSRIDATGYKGITVHHLRDGDGPVGHGRGRYLERHHQADLARWPTVARPCRPTPAPAIRAARRRRRSTRRRRASSRPRWSRSAPPPTPVTVLWSDFTTGKPDASPKPTDIVGIRWVLPTPAGRRHRHPHDVSARHHRRQHLVHSAMKLAARAVDRVCMARRPRAGGGGLSLPALSDGGRRRDGQRRDGRRRARRRPRPSGSRQVVWDGEGAGAGAQGWDSCADPKVGCSKVGTAAGRRHQRQHGASSCTATAPAFWAWGGTCSAGTRRTPGST